MAKCMLWIVCGLMLVCSSTAYSQDKTLAAFLAEKRNATLATIRADGSSQLTPVWFHWDGEQFSISMTTERVKYKNLARDPRISLCIDDVTGYAYVTAEGKAEIRDSDIWDDTRKILVKYSGEEGGAAHLERLKKEPRVLVVFTPTRMETLGLAD